MAACIRSAVLEPVAARAQQAAVAAPSSAERALSGEETSAQAHARGEAGQASSTLSPASKQAFSIGWARQGLDAL